MAPHAHPDARSPNCPPLQPLWDVLPFEEFSIRISRHDFHQLVEILDDVTPEQLAMLQAGVDRWHRYVAACRGWVIGRAPFGSSGAVWVIGRHLGRRAPLVGHASSHKRPCCGALLLRACGPPISHHTHPAWHAMHACTRADACIGMYLWCICPCCPRVRVCRASILLPTCPRVQGVHLGLPVEWPGVQSHHHSAEAEGAQPLVRQLPPPPPPPQETAAQPAAIGGSRRCCSC